MSRDFTYIDDIVDGITKAISREDSQHRVFNIGAGKPTRLMNFIAQIEKSLGKKARIIYLPMQDGDVVETFADITKARQELGYQPQHGIEEGVEKFVSWFKSYNGI